MIVSKKSSLILSSLLLMIFFSVSVTQVHAHSPSITNISYNSSSDILSVSINHVVSGDPNHFIESIQIRVNNSEVISESYTSQPGDSFTYNYNLTANIGSSIEVTAFCSISGSDTDTILVTESNGGTIGGQIPGYLGIITISVVTFIILTLYLTIRRWKMKE